MRAGAIALALLLAARAAAGTPAPATPAQDPDWHIPLAPPDAGPQQQPDAQRLREALARYRELAAEGGWAGLPAGPALQPGQRDARVVALRERLRVTGDFTGLPGTADAWFFDGGLQRALQGFQARHGLPATGVPDERTVAALDVPAAERVRQLETTLARWDWLPRDFGPRYLWVNVPGGSLESREDGATTLAMRVIAGHPDRPTPSFRDTVSAIVENPPWSVPRTIAVEDLLPTQQEDPTFLARLGIRVFDNQGREQDPARINWQRLGADRFPYRLRQDPGPLNSLGRLKFVLSNPWDIFLHDTPSRRLFDLNSRTLSSGCIRLEQPEELAGRLLAGVPGGIPFPLETRGLDSRGKGIPPGTPATRTVKLDRPITIYVVYLTAWVTPAGVVNFRPDVYGRDARLR
jgi:murein L,D-transpeptidase YcbB/YkuD